MQKMIPYEKLSKKEQKKQNAAKRGSWGNVSPVTRRSENPRAYNRAKARKTFSDYRNGVTGSFYPSAGSTLRNLGIREPATSTVSFHIDAGRTQMPKSPYKAR